MTDESDAGVEGLECVNCLRQIDKESETYVIFQDGPQHLAFTRCLRYLREDLTTAQRTIEELTRKEIAERHRADASEAEVDELRAVLYEPDKHGYESGAGRDMDLHEILRELKRERDEARGEVSLLTEQRRSAGEWQQMVDQLRRERDEARALLGADGNSTMEAIKAIYDERNALRTQVADLTERLEKAQRWNQQMVEKAASGGVLDGYRELGQKCAAFEAESARLREQLDEAVRALEPFVSQAPDLAAIGVSVNDLRRARAALEKLGK